MVIDYKEIPQANAGGGMQDTFELFTRDFLEDLGFEIVQHPDRGADGKKDLIVKEIRKGVGGVTEYLWLVSCKHYAHSGKSVNDTDEPDIIDRVNAHRCDGFMGVYSTLPAISLNAKLHGYKDKIGHQIYDRERIEKHLLNHTEGVKLAKRFFPISLEAYLKEKKGPAKLFSDESIIKCDYCGKNLITTGNGIMVNLVREIIDGADTKYSNVQDVYFSCKGEHDFRLQAKFRNMGLWDHGWLGIDDFKIPTIFLSNIIGHINAVSQGQYSKEAIIKINHAYINLFPYVSRDLGTEESERVNLLGQFGLL